MASEDMDIHREGDHLKTESSPLYLRLCPNSQTLYSLFPEGEFLPKKLLGSNVERLTRAFQMPLSPRMSAANSHKLNFHYIL